MKINECLMRNFLEMEKVSGCPLTQLKTLTMQGFRQTPEKLVGGDRGNQPTYGMMIHENGRSPACQ
jgi:hypothetical protein